MRRKLVLGVGLAGVLSGSAAVAQFAADRVPGAAAQPKNTLPFGGAQPAPVPFGGGQPVGAPSAPAMPAAPAAPANTPPAGGYVPPVGGFQPAGGAVPAGGGFRPAGVVQAQATALPNPADIPTALGPNHPLAVRPEHGAYFILVKSYSRPHRPDAADPGLTARQLAEGLAQEIQQTQRASVFLYEHISEERKAEAEAVALARQRAAKFEAELDKFRRTSTLQNMEFLEPDRKLYYRTFNFRDQIAVLVGGPNGGFRTEDEAVKALAAVKKWPGPRDTRLVDAAAVAQTGTDGKRVGDRAYLNPFLQAMVVPNPTTPKPIAAPSTGVDPFVVRLNEGRPYSLLKATKGWTLGVKSFPAPISLQTRDEDTSVMRRMGSGKSSDVLNAGAEQAEVLAKALRVMKGPDREPLNLEAFVLHTRTGSIVTVGQFDGPNDPLLHTERRRLANITFKLSKDEMGQQVTGTGQKLFGDNLIPLPVPKP